VSFPSFLTLILDGGEWLTSRPGRFNPRKEPRYRMNKWPDMLMKRNISLQIICNTFYVFQCRLRHSQSIYARTYITATFDSLCVLGTQKQMCEGASSHNFVFRQYLLLSTVYMFRLICQPSSGIGIKRDV
jgi:hypothetical protein